MFYIVPSNRQEYLLKVLIALLDSDYKEARLGIFEPSHIMVESLGMKHYVHMGIARESKVAMNLDFPLVSRGIYSLCRAILGEDRVPKESLFKREILVWRIEQILRSDDFLGAPDAKHATHYWQSAVDQEKARFLLAQNTADVFEQYMQFRPQWFAIWENNGSALATPNDTLEPWQRAIWQRLVANDQSYPAHIIEQAINAFTPGKSVLPKVLYIFVVNALTPQQLSFMYKISEQVDIYFFHLNPCVEYWGDLLSQRALMHERLRSGTQYLLDEASPNSLLANLGRQGRVLFNQLHTIDYPDFTDRALFASQQLAPEQNAPSLLRAIQHDLLCAQTGMAGQLVSENSVTIHSCHNHLREIQVLHDFLLHIIEQHTPTQANDKTLATIQPHDIIVLCPAVEEYAPYVKSVFRSTYEQDDAQNPRLVCSIADRAPLDADPMVGMFMDMLNLPDSRFSVTSLIDYLHIDSVQEKFDLSTADVELCERWIKDANIYWGKNASHKAHTLGDEYSSDIYTWEWGLARLLKSAFYADSLEHELSFSMLHNVEGQNISVLGKLMLFIDTLQTIDKGLRKAKSMQEWLGFMQADILQTLFAQSTTSSVQTALKRAIEQISNHISKAHYSHEVSLTVAREALGNILSRPDPLNQFNTGQVTFGSMVPMRSVPFKVVCILGLNDGVFPRSAQPLSIDLMVKDSPKPTDRSRRNEDRYMFLEALVSAREYLFLSYQGRSVKDNSVREPSLVLREFQDYLMRAFSCQVLTEHPLQAFSAKAFDAENIDNSNWSKRPSFSSSWLKVANEQTNAPASALGLGAEETALVANFELPTSLYSDALVTFFADPLEAFAKAHLQLSFERFMDAQDDTEPFSVKPLTQSVINKSMLDLAKSEAVDSFAEQIRRLYQSGNLPEIAPQHDMYKHAIKALIADIDFTVFEKGTKTDFSICIEHAGKSIALHTSMEVNTHGHSNVLYTHSVRNSHVFEFYLSHAIKRLHLGRNITSTLSFVDMKAYMKAFDMYESGQSPSRPQAALVSKEINDEVFDVFHAEAFVHSVLTAYKNGMSSPCLLHIDLGAEANKSLVKAKQQAYCDAPELPEALLKYMQQKRFLSQYVHYFYPNCANSEALLERVDLLALEKVYWQHLPNKWEL